jgi:hypothetical protein
MDSATQIALAASLVWFVVRWRYAQVERNRRSWHDIISTLEGTDWNWKDVRSLRQMFSKAPFLVQLADYATEHRGNPDASFLEELRRDAFTIRLFALGTLALRCLHQWKPTSSSR